MSGPLDMMMPYLKQVQEQFGTLFSGGNTSGQTSSGLFPSGMQNLMGGWPVSGGGFNPTDLMQNFGWQQGNSNYPVDIYETRGKLCVVAEIPGLTSTRDVSLEVYPDLLVIKGRTVRPYGEGRQQVLHVTERRVGEFERKVNLPVRVDITGATARYQGGLLEVQLVRLSGHDSPRGSNVPIDFR